MDSRGHEVWTKVEIRSEGKRASLAGESSDRSNSSGGSASFGREDVIDWVSVSSQHSSTVKRDLHARH